MAERTLWWAEKWLECRAIYLSFFLSIYLSTCLSICLSICLLVYLSICLFICLPASLKTKLFCEASSMLELDNIQNEAMLRDSPFSNLTTSKTKQTCQTSSISKLETSNIKNEAILRDLLQKWKAECIADGLVPMRFALFHSIWLKYCARHEKVRPGHAKCCTSQAKSS